MKANELRRKYIEFFVSKGHKEIPNASLIPQNDPTVLFTTAGMHPLVPFLLGQQHPLGKRLVNVQRCLRTDDIDEVGDNIHNTFFEMLGNWSLGDYFKKEAIEWSYEFLTSKKWLGIDKKRLAISVFAGDADAPRDAESAAIWKSLGIPPERIAYLSKKDNWWGPAGETGPCGPDTEMFYWASKEPPPAKFYPEDKGWVEVWNDVFMQYNKKPDGKFEPLKQKNVDTGMGLERVVAVLQGKESIFDTELFFPVIGKIQRIAPIKDVRAERIIADHLRAAVFVLGDDNRVAPSNVRHGYVLRRLIRRAIRHGRQIGIKNNFAKDVAAVIVDIYSEFYRDIKKNKDFILAELEKEETRFRKTLEEGMKVLHTEIEAPGAASAGKEMFSGKTAFKLYQSYGFPLEMTKEMLAEKNMKLDEKEFDEEFKKHQELSRKSTEGVFKSGLADYSQKSTRYHTATHLLNEALRKVVDPNIRQRGSNITVERMRFDFNFDRKLTPDEIKKVEDSVNEKINKDMIVTREEMPLQEALSSGAQSEFGVKYPGIVSVYTIGNFSKEICTGPHVSHTKEIGKFKIIKEESVAAGIRRIKAVVEP